MEHAFKNAGFKVGDQSVAEKLMEDWAVRDFKRIIKYCKTADVFQDLPFSLPFTYQALDQAFPQSKFILTIRDNPEQWYESLTRFHSKIVGKNRVPTAEDLKEFSYVSKGWLWRQQQIVYGATEENVYDKTLYIRNYEAHISDVKDYFKHREKDLLVINVSSSDAEEKLNNFISFSPKPIVIPHMNRT